MKKIINFDYVSSFNIYSDNEGPILLKFIKTEIDPKNVIKNVFQNMAEISISKNLLKSMIEKALQLLPQFTVKDMITLFKEFVVSNPLNYDNRTLYDFLNQFESAYNFSPINNSDLVK
jgi:vacuolar-type H+-ATPase subunit C/Vma6